MRSLLIALLIASSAIAADLEYYGVQKIADANVSNKLRVRFKAAGEPLFLLKDAHAGISIGDLIRFSDKAVLVDANVLQSLSQDGALRALNSARIIKLKAMGKSAVWKSRGSSSKGTDRNGYRLGEEILKVLEDNFGGMPKGEKIVLEFDGSYLAIVAPGSLLDRLRSAPVRKEEPKPVVKAPTPEKPRPKGVPQFVSPAPLPIRQGQSLDWQAWAVDSEHPSDDLTYSLRGKLPQGLTWDASSHRLFGQATQSDKAFVEVYVRNPNAKEDTLGFDLTVMADSIPRIQDQDLPEALRGQNDWTVQLAALDFDDKSSDLKWTLVSGPDGLTLDSLGKMEWSVPESAETGSSTAIVQVSDPWGGQSEREWKIPVVSTRERMKSTNVELSLPRDTLIQFHCMNWVPKWVASSNAKLVKVSGSRDVLWRDNTLIYCPSKPGADSLNFEFEVEGKALQLRKGLWIKPNRAPQWTASGMPALEIGESVSIAPHVVDPDGDTLTISAVVSDSNSMIWDGKRLNFQADQAGLHGVEWIASDAYGAETRFRSNLMVRPPKAEINRMNLRNLRQSTQSWWDLNYQRDAARFGLFSTDLNEHVYWETTRDSLTGISKETTKPLEDIYFPFLYVGASLLGSEAAAKGNYFFTDLGLTFRPLSDKIVGGGLMLRLSGQWMSADQSDRAMMEWMLSVKQGVVLTLDTRAQKAREELNSCVSDGNVDCINQVLQENQGLFPGCQDFDAENEQCIEAITTFGLGKGIDRVLESSASTWNVVHMLRFEYERRVWDLPGHYGSIWLGPTAWRRDVLLRPWFEEFIGGAAHWSGNYQKLHWNLGTGVGYGLAHREWTSSEKKDFANPYYKATEDPTARIDSDWNYKALEGMRLIFDLSLSWGR